MSEKENKPGLLLHICCAGCGVYVSELLAAEFQITLFFYNPNINPETEYRLRLTDVIKVSEYLKIPVINGGYDHDRWLKLITGNEKEPERGKRCAICYEDRIAETAREAVRRRIGHFATTLSVSPHKVATLISEIGRRVARDNGLEFYDRDFKKNDGFKKSTVLARQLSLYRQNYCGCEFSHR